MQASQINDDHWVAQSLDGNREAFGHIVERYQSLVCAIAYSATGSLSQSEDLAQETFITAWKQLASLRDPAKLRAWLCGIARNVVNDAIRRRPHEPLRNAVPLDATSEFVATDASPTDQTISKEEEAILWRSLEQIPETYREPLVLFYREHQSVEKVAEALELSEDAVKQRLSRGRKLLHQQVIAFVEGTLARTNPGTAFTLGVIAALPAFAASATAATVGVTAAKGSSAAKAAASLGIVGAILGPIIGVTGVILGVKASIETTQSIRERQFMIRASKIMISLIIVSILALSTVAYWARPLWNIHPAIVIGVTTGWVIGYAIALVALILWCNRTQRRIRAEENRRRPQKTAGVGERKFFEPFEYKSRWTLLGLPLVHVRMGDQGEARTRPAKGWIAIGDIAIGVVFACGGLAFGGIAFGGFSLGLVSIGGFALGAFVFGGLGMGVWAVGGGAVGYMAFGGGAIAWLAAAGGMGVAHDYAIGGLALAQHANDEVARAFIQNAPFFHFANNLTRYGGVVVWLPLVLVIWLAMRARRQARTESVPPS